MIKLLFVFSSIIFLFVQCSNNKGKYDNQISTEFEFSDSNVQTIVDSFIMKYPNEKLYELYIDKLDPHYAVLTIYSGNSSAVGNENYNKNQLPGIAINRKGTLVHIYSGMERYIKTTQEQNDSLFFEKLPGMQDGNYWIVTDSFGIYKIREERIYPFMPLPGFTPMVPDEM